MWEALLIWHSIVVNYESPYLHQAGQNQEPSRCGPVWYYSSALDALQIELEVFEPDENAKVLQGVVVRVEESCGHCPQALAFSRIWDGAVE